MRFLRMLASYLGKLVVFSGRATRKEFWIYAPLCLGTIWIVRYYSPEYWFQRIFRVYQRWGLDLSDPRISVLAILFLVPLTLYLAVFISIAIMMAPTISVQVRRFHDQNLSAWMLLLHFLLPGLPLIWMLVKGKPGPNKYGPDPLGRPAPVWPQYYPPPGYSMPPPSYWPQPPTGAPGNWQQQPGNPAPPPAALPPGAPIPPPVKPNPYPPHWP